MIPCKFNKKGGFSVCEFLQKCSRCLFLPSTWHGFPAKVFQVSFPAVHLSRNSRESVPGSFSCRPPVTEFLQKRSRCLSLPSTCHGIPAKVFQVAFPAVHLSRFSRESMSGVLSRRPPVTVFPRKCSKWHLPAFHLARYSCESVPGSFFRCPPGTEFLQKC